MKKKRKAYIAAVLIGLILGVILYGFAAYNEEGPASGKDVEEPRPTVFAQEAILINSKTGKVLYEKNSEKQGYPASTTKIMTALVSLKICEDAEASIKQQVVVPAQAVGVEGSSIYLKAEEKVSIEKLLYGLMLQSGNDAAETLATTLGGTRNNFVKAMNKEAKALGCINTNFINPSGLYDENHYTTAEDLAIIAREAMKNPIFRKIVASPKWENFYNKNKTVHQYQGGNGIKIGFTKASGRTLVASSRRNDVELICVVLADGNWFNDAYNLMDYGFQLLGCKEEKE